MGAPESGIAAGDQPAAETLLGALRTIKDGERVGHEQVLDYWLSIRGDKEFPPLHDLDPLEMSDAAPCSILLELLSGGQDAEIRHLGDALKDDVTVQRVIDAPNPSLLASIARKLPIVAISRDFLAYEDNFSNADGLTRCWITLLPLSSCGSWVDYVYAFVTLDKASTGAAKPVVEDLPEAVAETPVEPEIVEEQPVEALDEVVEEIDEPEAGEESPVEASAEPEPTEDDVPEKGGPGFARLLDGLSQLTGFYGQGVAVTDPLVEVDLADSALPPAEPEAAEPDPIEPLELDEPAMLEPELAAAAEAPPLELDQPAPALEESLNDKLTEVRAKADEARQAALRATAALHEGLSAAYDFALDAETSPEEYLRLVEAQGLKIQLRAPMAPVARLAFDGRVDPATLGQCEKILAWALKEELPRGALLERIDQAGGIGELAGEVAKAA